jgi:hypothetical protein
MTLDRQPQHQPNFLSNDQIQLLRRRVREMLLASKNLPNKKVDVFISYRQAESRGVAAQIFKALRRTRHPRSGSVLSVFLDDVRIKAGQNIHVAIQTAIRLSTTFIVLLSPTYNQTEYTTFEHMLIAGEDWGGLQERIIPVLVQDCEIPGRLRALKYLDFRSLASLVGGPSRPLAKKATQRLPDNLRKRIGDLSVRPEIERAVKQVLTANDYPTIMMLSRESVVNPIWRLIVAATRDELSKVYSPLGNLPPRIMHLDIFLIRANDTMGRPRLLNYFSGKPITGWQAFMLPFRHRRPGESESTRQRENAKDIAEFLGFRAETVQVSKRGNQFVVSVKPDPGYSELVAYIFEFCSVRFKVAPEWLRAVDCTLTLDKSVRRFRWLHPEEMEQQERSMLVDGDVIRGVHYFFGTTLPAVPVGFPITVD